MATSTVRAPGPPPLAHLNNILSMRRDMLGFFTELARKYGDVVYIRLGSRRLYLVSDPELIQDVLVTDNRLFHKSWALKIAKFVLGEGLLTSEDDFHRRQRKLIQPAFHRQKINGYGEAMTEYAAVKAGAWQDGQTVDMAEEMSRLTLSVVARTLFDATVDQEAEEIGEAFTQVLDLLLRVTTPFAGLLSRLPLPSNKRFVRARARLYGTIDRIIAERRASAADRPDLLSMLLNAQDEDDGEVMTDRQLRDEAITLFLAGHETTAVALTWTWYLLSQNPDAEAKLHRELDEVLGGRLPNVDVLPRLAYTRKVLTESMRLYPPAFTLGREALQDYPLGPYLASAGSMIIMSQYVVHRSPNFYTEPQRFDPDRWTSEMQERLPRFAYFPFGGGPRVCIGEGFAWMEAMLILATLAQRWQARLVPGHPVALLPLITLRPRYGMRMTLQER